MDLLVGPSASQIYWLEPANREIVEAGETGKEVRVYHTIRYDRVSKINVHTNRVTHSKSCAKKTLQISFISLREAERKNNSLSLSFFYASSLSPRSRIYTVGTLRIDSKSLDAS